MSDPLTDPAQIRDAMFHVIEENNLTVENFSEDVANQLADTLFAQWEDDELVMFDVYNRVEAFIAQHLE